MGSNKCYIMVDSVLENFGVSWFNQSLLTYLLTPWCRVLLEKLTGLQVVKKFPTLYRTRRFITALTSVRHLIKAYCRIFE